MSVTVDIINIGTLSRNVVWSEPAPVRPAHATTTLIRDGDAAILVDPALPPELMKHRLDERSGLKPSQIDTVFLTNFSPVHRRGLTLFNDADWYLSELERDTVLAGLNAVAGGQTAGSDLVSLDEVQSELELLGRIRISPEKLAEHVDFFPTYGSTPGSASLLVAGQRTIVIAGDAVVTRDYFAQNRIWDRATNPEQAKESFAELVEIADAIVPGHDNILYLG